MGERKEVEQEIKNALLEQLALLRRASEQVSVNSDEQCRGLCNLTDALVKVVTCLRETC